MISSKQVGGMFFFLATLALVVSLTYWDAGYQGIDIVSAAINCLKYLALADLTASMGIIFWLRAPDRKWDWQTVFSLGWWQEEWLIKAFKLILIFGVVFLIGAIVLDFAFKLALASGTLDGVF